MSLTKLAAALAFACALLGAGPARAWNIGTHVYVVEKLLAPQVAAPSLLMEAAYGSTALDLFNNDFTPPGLYLQQWLHDPSGELFMEVWREGATAAPAHRAFAFGLVSHNNAWGADATAHVVDIASGQGPGWTYAKSELLLGIIGPSLPPEFQQLPHEVLVEVGHILIEQAVDLLMLQVDPSLGAKLMAAAAARSPSDPARLEVAWSGPFAELLGSNAAGVQMIRAYEAGSREMVMAYGWALSQPNALDLLSWQIAVVATDFLGVPPDRAEDFFPLIKGGIELSELLCAGDFYQEIEGTVAWVGANMAAHGATY